ncbi:hypothetical protein [Cecembia calidifontis]|uniref:Neutral/alkaline ceramidase-like enzyme n=1 Tax=Cecembia calidifontis TaxID=1187080 RepID=A0A4Q7PBU4_9BACT|nr:hypothetical protein [Cecembia calidifontis]RZS97731.1 hypothetical protein BC751_3351 [Cecembia calidifontis]
MKKWIKILLIFCLLFLVSFIVYSFFQFKDRHQGYFLNLNYDEPISKGFQAGFGKFDITPSQFDTWTDANGDARFNEKDGDFFHDLNKNGKFDPIWLAGFHQNRPASGVNDPLWARSIVIDNGDFRLALCVIDMISFGNDEVIDVRKRLDPGLKIDYLFVSSTHVHSSPDLMGMYGPDQFTRGVNVHYLEEVKQGILASLEEAVSKMEPAYFKVFQENEAAVDLVGDTRQPSVLDASIQILQVISKNNNNTLGTLLNWGNHPETLWSGNTLISSDFPHYFRKYVEEGIVWQDSLYHDGLGGVAVFLNGALGGLMTTHPGIPISHPITGEVFTSPNIDKIDAQGMKLAKIVLEKLGQDAVSQFDLGAFHVRAKSIDLPLENRMFWLGAWTGIFDRGFVKWGKIRSELAAWNIGPVSFVHVPGELYPEILNGGVESPEGADFNIPPVEVPSIRSQMGGKVKFFNGMSNDMIGYIVPKSQWDAQAPYTYGYLERPYGEINSLGPETAPVIHKNILQMLNEIEKSSINPK